MSGALHRRKRFTRMKRRGALALGILAGVVLLTMAVASLVVQGPRFGRLVERNLPRTGGTIHVGSGSWSWPALWALWRGRPAAFAFDDVVMVDPEDVEVFRAERLNADLRVVRGPSTRIEVSDLQVQGATWRFAPMRARPEIGFLAALSPPRRAPANARDKARPPPVPGATVTTTTTTTTTSSGIVFQIINARLEGLDAAFSFPDWDLTLRDVHASGDLTVDTRRGARPVFTFAAENAEVRGGGRLAVLQTPQRRTLTFSGARLDRVATTADAADAIALDASAIVAGRSTLSFAGRFTGIYGNGAQTVPPTGMDARIRVEQAADAIASIVSADGAQAIPDVAITGGRETRLDLSLVGPFSGLAVDARARGFDVARGALSLMNCGFRLQGRISTGALRLTDIAALSPEGGRLHGDATLTRDRGGSRLAFEIALSDFVASSGLPDLLRPFAAGTWNGAVAGQIGGAAQALRLSLLDLTLTRPSEAKGPRAIKLRLPAGRAGSGVARDVVSLPSITTEAWGGRLTANGTIALSGTPLFDLTLGVRRISVDRLFPSSLATGAITATLHAQGTANDLMVRTRFAPASTLKLFGETFKLPANSTFRIEENGLSVPRLHLAGAHGGALDVEGRLGRNGVGRLTVVLRAFPFAKLPAFAESDFPLAGHLDGQLSVSLAAADLPIAPATSGSAPNPERPPHTPHLIIKGRLSISGTTFQGRSIGGGVVDVFSDAGGSLRVRGTIIDGVALDGTLAPAMGGVAGDARLRFDGFRLDPFLAWLPGGATAAGTLSGTARARVAPHTAPTMEARLTTLVLRVTGPRSSPGRDGATASPARARSLSPPPTIELHAVGDVAVSARAASPQRGGATLRLLPARFVGSAGSLELAGEITATESRGSARGRLDLGVWSDIGRQMIGIPWLEQLAGHVDVDIHATTKSGDVYPTLVGNVGLLSTARLRWAGTPLEVAIDGGRIDLLADGSARVDLPVRVAGSHARVTGDWRRPATAPSRGRLDADGEVDARLLQVLRPRDIARASGRARLHARWEDTGAAARFSARLDIAPPGLVLALPAVGPEPLQITRGRLEARSEGAMHLLLVHDLALQQGTRNHAVVGASSDGPATVTWVPPRRGGGVGTIDLPMRGSIRATTVRPVAIDEAHFTARLHRYAANQPLQLKGDVDIVRARVDAGAAKRASTSPSGGTAGWRNQPAVRTMTLDLAIRSQGRAITVELPYLPDVRVDIDYRVQGTATHPRTTGNLRSTGPYNRAALLLYRLFQ